MEESNQVSIDRKNAERMETALYNLYNEHGEGEEFTTFEVWKQLEEVQNGQEDTYTVPEINHCLDLLQINDYVSRDGETYNASWEFHTEPENTQGELLIQSAEV